jgi:hypothetical protein
MLFLLKKVRNKFSSGEFSSGEFPNGINCKIDIKEK